MLHRSCIWALALLATLAGPWSPAQLPAAGKDPALPFLGIASGMITDAVSNELFMEYAGTATHLGRFTAEQQIFLNPDGSFSGTIVLTAANGDELRAEFSGEWTSPTTAEGSMTLTGGTGRFEDATGEAIVESYTPDGIHFQTEFEGWIRY